MHLSVDAPPLSYYFILRHGLTLFPGWSRTAAVLRLSFPATGITRHDPSHPIAQFYYYITVISYEIFHFSGPDLS